MDPKSYLDMYPEMVLPEDQKQAFLRERSSAIVGRRLLDLYGWRIGQNVTLQGTIFPGDWTFTIRGVYTPSDPVINDDMMLFHHEYLEERIGRPGMAGWYIIEIDDANNAAPIAQDARRPVPELERAHQDRHRAGVQRQLCHHVGQREPPDGHHRHGGGLRDPAGDRERDDDERPRAHWRNGGAQDHRLHRPDALRDRHARGRYHRATGAFLGLGGAKLLYKATNFNAAGFLPGFDVTAETLLLGGGVALRADARKRPGAGGARRAAAGGAGAPEGRVKIPLSYNARSLIQRPVSTAFTALGIALVVAVFIGMLALANGFRSALIRTGSTQNVLILRRGADSEMSSSMDRQSVSILASSPMSRPVATGGRW